MSFSNFDDAWRGTIVDMFPSTRVDYYMRPTYYCPVSYSGKIQPLLSEGMPSASKDPNAPKDQKESESSITGSQLVFEPQSNASRKTNGIWVYYDSLDGIKDFFDRVESLKVYYKGDQILNISGAQWSTWIMIRNKNVFTNTGDSRMYIPVIETFEGVFAVNRLKIVLKFNKDSGDEHVRAGVLLGENNGDPHGRNANPVFEVLTPSTEVTLDHKQTEVSVSFDFNILTDEGKHGIVDVIYGIYGGNYVIQTSSLRFDATRGSEISRFPNVDFRNPYESSVLDKVLNGTEPPKKAHILTFHVGYIGRKMDPIFSKFHLSATLDGDSVPDGTPFYAYCRLVRSVE